MIWLKNLLTQVAIFSLAISSGACAMAAEKIIIAHNGVIDYAPVFLAHKSGKFKKSGLDVDVRMIPASGSYGAGLISNSIQIAALTPPAFLQAVDSGLDLVAISSGGIVVDPSALYLGIVVRGDADVNSARQLEGKKVAINALGSILHVMGNRWLKVNGADPAKVTFVEAPMPQLGDLLRASTVDAIITIDPFMTRVLQGGNAKLMAPSLVSALPSGIPNYLWVANREWALKNRSAIAAFRKSIAESMAQINADPALGRDATASYVRMPRPAIDASYMVTFQPGAGEDSLGGWEGILNEQKMLRKKVQIDQLWVK